MASNPARGRTRAVVLLSGGMDSCVCAALAARDHDAAAVHVSYGQRTEARERRAFEAICDRLGIRNRLIVRNEALRAIGGSALTDAGIAVPESRAIGAGVPVTYVPFRNAHFLAVAVSWAEVLGRRKSLYRGGRARQLRLSRLPSRLLSCLQRGRENRYEGRDDPDCDAADRHAQT